MAKKNDGIVRYTPDELLQRKGLSDWEAAAKVPLPDGSDPDDAMEDGEWFTTVMPLPPRKEHTNLRLDTVVLDFFRGQGKGYQSRINAVLRTYVEHAKLKQGR